MKSFKRGQSENNLRVTQDQLFASVLFGHPSSGTTTSKRQEIVVHKRCSDRGRCRTDSTGVRGVSGAPFRQSPWSRSGIAGNKPLLNVPLPFALG